jgi:hypothetical protein
MHCRTKIIAAGYRWFPVFLGLIFSKLQNRHRSTQALRVNLFGAVIGGILENSVMIRMVTVGILAIRSICFRRFPPVAGEK